jgi:hypothetical protein
MNALAAPPNAYFAANNICGKIAYRGEAEVTPAFGL